MNFLSARRRAVAQSAWNNFELDSPWGIGILGCVLAQRPSTGFVSSPYGEPRGGAECRRGTHAAALEGEVRRSGDAFPGTRKLRSAPQARTPGINRLRRLRQSARRLEATGRLTQQQPRALDGTTWRLGPAAPAPKRASRHRITGSSEFSHGPPAAYSRVRPARASSSSEASCARNQAHERTRRAPIAGRGRRGLEIAPVGALRGTHTRPPSQNGG